MLDPGGLAGDGSVGVADGPDGGFLDAEATAGAGDADALIIVDIAVAGDILEKSFAFGAVGGLGGETGGHADEGVPVEFKEFEGGTVTVVEDGVGFGAVGEEEGGVVPKHARSGFGNRDARGEVPAVEGDEAAAETFDVRAVKIVVRTGRGSVRRDDVSVEVHRNVKKARAQIGANSF